MSVGPVRTGIRGLSRFRGAALVRRAGLVSFLAVMGPGLITGFSGNDAGGVTTYTTVGARYGFALLWLLLVASASLLVMLETCARMGAATGKGLSDLIRERFGVRWTILAMLALFVANGSNVIAEFAGIAASLDLLGVPTTVSVPVAGGVIWALIVFASYRAVERALLLLVLAYIAYPVSVVVLRPDWSAVAGGLLPSVPRDPTVLVAALALVGTTVTPYLLFYVQASVVDKGIDRARSRYAVADASLGAVLAGLMAFCIVVVAGAVLFPAGIAADSAAEAANALRPLAGELAVVLFGMGLLGASLLGAVVMPLSTSYAICEAFGWESGISHRFREAPVFMGLVTLLLGAGAAIVLFVPAASLLPLIVVSQAVNGLLLPIILIFIVRLATDERIMGNAVNGPLRTALSWGFAGLAGALSVGYVVATALGL